MEQQFIGTIIRQQQEKRADFRDCGDASLPMKAYCWVIEYWFPVQCQG
jgi:hypothetical protein